MSLGFGMFTRFLPGLTPRLIDWTFLVSRPLGSTATPASSGFPATTGRSAGERRVGTHCLRFLPRHAPSRDLGGLLPRSPYRRSPSHVPCKSRRPGSRRLYAGHHLASNTGTRQAHPERTPRPPGFDAIYMDFDASTAHARPEQDRAERFLERLPGPHLTRSSPPSPCTLTTTVFSQRSTGWFDAYPRRADAGGPTSLHLSHSTAYVRCSSTQLLLQRS